jgi:hypothetical protein
MECLQETQVGRVNDWMASMAGKVKVSRGGFWLQTVNREVVECWEGRSLARAKYLHGAGVEAHRESCAQSS